MRNTIITAATGIALTALLSGCNAMNGGPSANDITSVAREQMVVSASLPELKEVARAAEITPRGLCNNVGETFACIVDIKTTLNGVATEQQMVVELKKDDSGKWVTAS